MWISEFLDRTGSGIGNDLEDRRRIDKQMPSEFDQLFDLDCGPPIWQTLATTQLVETVFPIQPYVARNFNILKLVWSMRKIAKCIDDLGFVTTGHE
jgi:hypothetical protein